MAELREDAEAIWQAAIAAVSPQHVVTERFSLASDALCFDDTPLQPLISLPPTGRIVVVGGGKAAAGVAAGLEELFPPDVPLQGLVGVPAGSGLRLPRLEVREVRPAGRNEPTAACVEATQEMCTLLAQLNADDLAIAIITGGGSAILTAPRPGIPLEEVIATTRWLSERGADISQLNRVRQAVSSVKAGGLARHCRSRRLVAIVISDVIGDPLETISSGPCMPVVINSREALTILEAFGAVAAGVAPSIVNVLQQEVNEVAPPHDATTTALGRWHTPFGCAVSHHLLASNATAVEAAAARAQQLGYHVRLRHADPRAHETAAEVGQRLVREGRDTLQRGSEQRIAIVEGGEATVTLPADHGQGGRNQHTVAAAIATLTADGTWPRSLLLASLGTDGEDGPTTAAGGCADAAVAAAVQHASPPVAEAVARCDAFPLLQTAGGLIQTGPTGTNVADVRIVLIDRNQPLGGPAQATSHASTASRNPA